MALNKKQKRRSVLVYFISRLDAAFHVIYINVCYYIFMRNIPQITCYKELRRERCSLNVCVLQTNLEPQIVIIYVKSESVL